MATTEPLDSERDTLEETLYERVTQSMCLTKRHREKRIPAPLIVGGTETRLTKWLELATWKPVEAALIVCGFDPGSYTEEFPYYGKKMRSAIGLWGDRVLGEDSFFEFDRILKRLNSEIDLPEKIQPTYFVAWCKSKGIDTGWLAAVQADTISSPTVAHPESVTSSAKPVPAAVDMRDCKETPVERKKRLQMRINHWKSEGVSDYTNRVAAEEGVSVCRIRQILNHDRKISAEAEPKAKSRRPATPFDGLVHDKKRTR